MKETIRYIRIDRIQPNYRISYSNEDIARLCARLFSEGGCEPIEVLFDGEAFRIIDGEKRWRAMKRLGMTYVKATIKETYRSF